MENSTVRESILTRYAELVGDQALQAVSEEMFKSGAYQIVMSVAATAAFIAVGLAFHRRRATKYPIFVFITVAFLTPYNGRPSGFVIVDQFARACSSMIDQAVMAFAANSSDPNSATNMHPGLVMDMFAAAASSEIKNPETKELFHKFLAKCMDNAMTTRGEPATYDDLFEFDASYRTVGDRVVLSFDERKLDPRSLENDDSIADVQPGMNCHTALKEVRSRMVQDLEEQPFVVNERVMTGGSSADESAMKSTDKWFDNWKESNSPFMDLARNVRIGIASQYEKSHLINELGWDNTWFGGYYKSTNMDAGMREMMLGLDSAAVDAGFQFSNIRELPARLSGNRWAFSLGAEMKELKEKIELLPYHIAGLKNLLKLACPIFILLLVTGRFQFFSMWAGSWFALTVSPSIITALRSVHNSIILSKLGIQDLTNQVAGNKTLAAVVNVDHTKALMEDFVPLAYALMKQEIWIVGALASLVIGGSWLAGMVGNGMVGWLGSSVTGQIMGQALGGGVGMVAQTVTNMTSSSSTNSSSGGSGGGQGAFPRMGSTGGPKINPVQNSNEMPTGPSFSSIFARKE